jgi:hypothetical protein
MAMLSRSHVERDQFLLIYGWHTGRTLLKAASGGADPLH